MIPVTKTFFLISSLLWLMQMISLLFSGSGNSPNVVEAVLRANKIGMKTHAVLGFDGGKCKELAGNAIHIPIDNMQVAEDFQMIIGHILMLRPEEKELKNGQPNSRHRKQFLFGSKPHQAGTRARRRSSRHQSFAGKQGLPPPLQVEYGTAFSFANWT